MAKKTGLARIMLIFEGTVEGETEQELLEVVRRVTPAEVWEDNDGNWVLQDMSRKLVDSWDNEEE